MKDTIFREIVCNGLNIIDLGSSGGLEKKWEDFNAHINLIGFDPNEEECARQNATPNKYKSRVVLPNAVHGATGTYTLYKTTSPYCYSLLKPNTDWLQRFSFADLFHVEEEVDIEAVSLQEVEGLRSFNADVIKIDVQGLELPILSNGGKVLSNVFYMETESGFVENYVGESTFWKISKFMEENDFILFDINPDHRVPRANTLAAKSSTRAQILWAEAIWLRDYIAIERRDAFSSLGLTRGQAQKVLFLCGFQGCFDFGLELAELFAYKNLLEQHDLQKLKSVDYWESELNSLRSESQIG